MDVDPGRHDNVVDHEKGYQISKQLFLPIPIRRFAETESHFSQKLFLSTGNPRLYDTETVVHVQTEE